MSWDESAGQSAGRRRRGPLHRPSASAAWRGGVRHASADVPNVSRVQCSTRRPRPHIAPRATPPPYRSAAPRVRWARRAGRGPGPRACCFWPRGWRPSLQSSLVLKRHRRRQSRAPPAERTKTRGNTAWEWSARACWQSSASLRPRTLQAGNYRKCPQPSWRDSSAGSRRWECRPMHQLRRELSSLIQNKTTSSRAPTMLSFLPVSTCLIL